MAPVAADETQRLVLAARGPVAMIEDPAIRTAAQGDLRSTAWPERIGQAIAVLGDRYLLAPDRTVKIPSGEGAPGTANATGRSDVRIIVRL